MSEKTDLRILLARGRPLVLKAQCWNVRKKMVKLNPTSKSDGNSRTELTWYRHYTMTCGRRAERFCFWRCSGSIRLLRRI